MAVFHGIPAIYNIHHFRQPKRRTATSIMAGCFDPLPYFPGDFSRDSDTSSTTSSISVDESLSHVIAVPTTESRKANSKTSRGEAGKKGKQGAAVLGLAKVMAGNGKKGKHGKGEEKENSGSILSDGSRDPHGVTAFWLARSSNTSASPAPPPLKRKRSTISRDDAHPHAKSASNKRSRLSEPATEAVSRASSQMLGSSVDPGSPPISVVSSQPQFAEEELEQLVIAGEWDKSKFYEVKRAAGVFCKKCGHHSPTVNFMIQHIAEEHYIDLNAKPPTADASSAPQKQRGERKNKATRKGWKGWIEVDPTANDAEPTNLIRLDQPVVLPERTTRSGRKID